MRGYETIPNTARLLALAGVLASGFPGQAVSAQPATPADARPTASATQPMSSPYRPNRFSKRAGTHYGLVWGIDSLSVKSVESGEIIRFAYRVLDPEKARLLNDKKVEPALIDPKAGVKLVVPSLEKVGQLRQSGTPQAGKAYWMAFSNKGRLVRRGDRVSVVIGHFRADGLVVD